MSDASPFPQTKRALPALLKLLIVTCFLRAAWGLVEVFPLLGYVISGRIKSPWVIYFLIFEAISWIILGTSMWRLHAWARLAAIAFAALLVVLAGRGLILMMMQRSSSIENYALVIVFLALDFFIIGYLAQPRVQALFEPKLSQTAAVSSVSQSATGQP